MVNHMAQGAATSMEDGAFLARALGAVVQGRVTLPEAIEIYEKGRMPKAYLKQQVSFLNGAIWHLPDGPLQEVSFSHHGEAYIDNASGTRQSNVR